MKWHVNITVKVLGYLLVAGILPLVLLGLTAFEISKRIVIEQAESENSRLIASFSSYLHLYQDQIEDMATNIAGNPAIGLALRHADEKTKNTFGALEMRAQMGYILNSYVRVKGLVSINLFSIGGEHFQVGQTLDYSPVQKAAASQLLAASMAASTPILWRGIDNNLNVNSAQKKVISVVRAIQSFSPTSGKSEVVGVLVIDLNDEIMSNFLEGVQLAAGTQLMQLDRNGNIELHSDTRRFGQPLIPALLQLVRATPPVHQLILDGEEVLMNTGPLDKQQRLIVAITPRYLLTQKVNRLGFATFGLVVLALLGILALTWYFARTVVRPIRAVSEGFRRIETNPQGRYDPLPTGLVLNEISQLVHGYNGHLTALQTQREASVELHQAKTAAEAATRTVAAVLHIVGLAVTFPFHGAAPGVEFSMNWANSADHSADLG